jgi:AcrR family transcriptional regulator
MPTELPSVSLRERRRKETHRQIADTGLAMFLRDGFDETTLDAIAAEAGISRRTFFHYFPTKEAIFKVWETQADEAIIHAIANQKRRETPLEDCFFAFGEVVRVFSNDKAIAITQLMRSTDALQAHYHADCEHKERVVCASLAQRWPDPERVLGLRMIAMAFMGCVRLATSGDGGNIGVMDFVSNGLAVLHRELTLGRSVYNQ